MPGKYLEYIKYGQHVVPIELTFLPVPMATTTDGFSSKTTKWAEHKHWKDLKSMLKVGVELCCGTKEISPDRQHEQIAFGQEVGIGYSVSEVTEGNHFLAVLDTKRNCWTDDEGETTNEDEEGVDKRLMAAGGLGTSQKLIHQPRKKITLKDYGGSCTSLGVSRKYIRAIVLKKSADVAEDSRRLRHELNDISKRSSSQNLMRNWLESNKETRGGAYDFAGSSYQTVSDRMSASKKHTKNECSDYFDDDDDDEEMIRNAFVPFMVDSSLRRTTNDSTSDDDLFSLPDLDRDICPSHRNVTLPSTKTTDLSSSSYQKSGLQMPSMNRTTTNSRTFPVKTNLHLLGSELLTKTYSRSPSSSPVKSLTSIAPIVRKPTRIVKPRVNAPHRKEAVTPPRGDLQQQRPKRRAPRPSKVKVTAKVNSVGIGTGSTSSKQSGNFGTVPAPMAVNPGTLQGPTPPTAENLRIPMELQSPEQTFGTTTSPKVSLVRRKPRATRRTLKGAATLDLPLSNNILRGVGSPTRSIAVVPPPAPDLKQVRKRKRRVDLGVTERVGSGNRSKVAAGTSTNARRVTLESDTSGAALEVDPEMPVLIPQVDLPSLSALHDKPVKKRRRLKSKVIGMDKATSTRSSGEEDQAPQLPPPPLLRIPPILLPQQAVTPPVEGPVQNTPVSVNAPVSDPSRSHTSSVKIKMERIVERIALTPSRKPIEITLDDDPFSFDHIAAPKNTPGPSTNTDTAGPQCAMMPPPSKRPPRTPCKSQDIITRSSTAGPSLTRIPFALSANSNVLPSAGSTSSNVPLSVGPSFSASGAPSGSSNVTPYAGSTPSGSSNVAPYPGPSGSSSTAQYAGPGPSSIETSKLSSYKLLTSTNLLRAGMGLMNKFATNKLNAKEVGRRLGFIDKTPGVGTSREKLSPVRSARELSPDITSYPPVTKRGKRRTRSEHHGNQGHSDDELMSWEEEDSQEVQGGEALVREVLSRKGGVDSNDQDFYDFNHEEGDECDLSQQSYCLLNIVPEYQRKSRLHKMHSKNIADLTCEGLIEHYTMIKPALRAIFEGEVPSTRNSHYLEGSVGKKKLKQIMVSVPFDNDQCSQLLTLLFEYFVPNISTRQQWSDYITYVMVPEALIRIYARVNDISEELAETEMRYGGCYDEPLLPVTLPTASATNQSAISAAAMLTTRIDQ